MYLSKKIIGVLITLIGIFWAFMWYLFIPALNLRSPGFWCFLVFTLVCVSLILKIAFDGADLDKQDKIFKVALRTILIVLALFLLAGLVSIRLFNAGKAQKVADVTVSEVSIEEDFPDLMAKGNINNLPLVDLDTARVLGDKKLAQLNHASWYDVADEYNLVKYQDKYYRLSVVDYGGFFKWTKAKTNGTPGYVLVDVTPKNGVATQEAKLVELENGIFYSPGAFFQKDLRRHLRFQYMGYIFSSKSYLEIDEEGTPYWITSVLRPTAGVFGVMAVKSFVVTNAQTGESKEYAVEEMPEWIDHSFSLEYLMRIAGWHYAYGDGFWNNFFSKTNVFRTSYYYRDEKQNNKDSEAGQFANFFGYNSMIDKDGQILFYTGLTAANNAESNVGWLTINTSTGKITQYSIVGAEESSAQAAVEQLVQDLRYEATFPLPANIAGNPSYIMVLKGKAGLAQGYAICNVENYSVAVQADTLDKAISLYLNKLGAEPMLPQEDTETLEKTAKIEAIHTAEIDGTTHFYYVIEGDLYRAAVTLNQQQVLLEVGDKVNIKYHADGEIFTITKIERIK